MTSLRSGGPKDFPRIAKEMGFSFSLRRGRVDWHKIGAIDVDRLVQERDLVSLQENLISIVNYNLDSEYDVKILDPSFVKLFKLAQLAIDYLMYSEQHVYNCLELEQQHMKKYVKVLLKLVNFYDFEIDNLICSTVKEIINIPTDTLDAMLYAPRRLQGLGVFKAQWEAYLQHLNICQRLLHVDNPHVASTWNLPNEIEHCIKQLPITFDCSERISSQKLRKALREVSFHQWSKLKCKGLEVVFYSHWKKGNSWISTKKGLSSSQWTQAIKMNCNTIPVYTLPGRTLDSTRCRRCDEQETLPHILGFFHHGELLQINQTNMVRSLIAASVRQNASYGVYEEVDCVSSDGSTRRADIIIIDRQKDKGVILDPTILFEMHEQQPQEVCREKQVIYEPCCQNLGAQYHITHWTVFGPWHNPLRNFKSTYTFKISDATIDAIGSYVLKSFLAIISNHLYSRNFYYVNDSEDVSRLVIPSHWSILLQEDEVDKLKRECKKKDDEIKNLKRKLKETQNKVSMTEMRQHQQHFRTSVGEGATNFFKCPQCGKTFLTAGYLEAHHERRHVGLAFSSPTNPTPEPLRSETERLQSEIKELKERLNIAEQFLNKAADPPLGTNRGRGDEGKKNDATNWAEEEKRRLEQWQEEQQRKCLSEIADLKAVFYNEIKVIFLPVLMLPIKHIVHDVSVISLLSIYTRYEEKRAIYIPTIPYYKDKHQLHDISVTGLMFGARGTIPNFSSQFCKTLGMHKSFLNELTLLIIRESVKLLQNHLYGLSVLKKLTHQ
ncbi:hypothetical protein ANN_21285 [Periplaneta americana]|uniref:C2H2-type domain-containing protein n=1 Tax=Periplaneta americana TaxID=6978 RepID=A0ABQ8SG41_PERAM|nr:hypothetical protein ANN_21285 [Periplaneta americana]